MTTKVFKDVSLDKCIENASSELNIPIEELVYEILEDKKGLFKKSVIISVSLPESEIAQDVSFSQDSGTIEIVNGKIIVKNPVEANKPAIIVPTRLVNVMIDGSQIYAKKEVFEHNLIELIFEENQSKRDIKISMNEDNTEAYVSIKYTPKVIFGLKDTEKTNMLILEPEIKEKQFPPVFTADEIKNALSAANVSYGIIKENVGFCQVYIIFINI